MSSSFTSSHSYMLQVHEGWLFSPAESVQIQKSKYNLFFHHSTTIILLTTYRTLAPVSSAFFNKVSEGKKQAITKGAVKTFVVQTRE